MSTVWIRHHDGTEAVFISEIAYGTADLVAKALLDEQLVANAWVEFAR